jgi:hypothetical protein
MLRRRPHGNSHFFHPFPHTPYQDARSLEMTMRADFIWMNGKIIPWDQANVHVFTHALHYGSSVFALRFGCGFHCGSTLVPLFSAILRLPFFASLSHVH